MTATPSICLEDSMEFPLFPMKYGMKGDLGAWLSLGSGWWNSSLLLEEEDEEEEELPLSEELDEELLESEELELELEESRPCFQFLLDIWLFLLSLDPEL